VLVSIEEPHMYNEDDAVAKLDGYVISVTGAGKLVGEKTLVRIEKVGRSAAQATLVNPPPEEDGGGGRPRRRGRRGGRRRRKSAETAG
jgi:ribonuclease G